MATKAAVSSDAVATEQDVDATLLDTQSAAVKRLIARGKERGYITFDELNAVLPPDQNSSEQIEDVMAMLSEIGIQVVESEETEEGEAGRRQGRKGRGQPRSEEPTGNVDEESLGRTDDPVRMYLREMGSVELLSREGEIAIAKRIEAGRDMMIGGLCESPLTFRAIIAWHEALKAGRMLLRDIIDLEATQGGPAPAGGGRGRRRGRTDRGVRRGGRTRGGRGRRGARPVAVGAGGKAQARGARRPSRKSRRSTRSCTRCRTRRLETIDLRRGGQRALRKDLRKAARRTGPQGPAGPSAQQPHRGAGHPAQAAQPAADRL